MNKSEAYFVLDTIECKSDAQRKAIMIAKNCIEAMDIWEGNTSAGAPDITYTDRVKDTSLTQEQISFYQ